MSTDSAPPLQQISLQRRLLLLCLAWALLVWLLAAALTWQRTQHELDELLDAHLAQAAALLVAQQAVDPHQLAPGLALPPLHRYAPKVAFQILHEGQWVWRSAEAPDQPWLAPGTALRQGFFDVSLQGRAWRVFGSAGAQADVQVFVGEQVASRADILQALLTGALGPLLIALPLLLLGMAWAVRQGTAPLRLIRQRIAEREPLDLRPVELPSAPKELQGLLEALNQLLARTSRLVQTERRFTADAAHELRTPLAAIRTQAQVAQAETDAAARQHALRTLLTACDRSSHLIDQLLALARLDASLPANTAHTAQVDLSQIAREVISDLADVACQRQQDLSLDAPPTTRVRGDALWLRVLLRNALDNALRYSPAGAAVNVTITLSGPCAELCIEDNGPGLSPTDMAHWGERFFRAAATGTEPSPSGSGLGASIIRRVAEVHGLGLQLDRSPLGGLRLRLRWPEPHSTAALAKTA